MSLSGLTRVRNRILGGVLLLTLLPAAAAADEMVPADVVLELLEVAPRYGAGAPSLIIGAAPGELSELLVVPEDLEVVISLVWGEASSIIGRSELSKAQLTGQLEGGLVELGWSRYRPETSSKGFQPSAEDSGIVFCREQGDTLAVEIESKSAEETRARLKHQKGHGFSSCKKLSQYERLENLHGEEVPFPTLYPPDGAKSQGGGGGSAGDFERSARTRLETDLAPADILVHYASQLGQQGWAPDARVEYDSLAYQSWLFLDEVGKQWHGLLMVKANPRAADQRDVELQVTYLGSA